MVWHCPCLLGTHRPGVVMAVTLEDRLRLGAPLGWGKGPEGWRSVWMRKAGLILCGWNAGLCLRPGWEVRARPGHWVFRDASCCC